MRLNHSESLYLHKTDEPFKNYFGMFSLCAVNIPNATRGVVKLLPHVDYKNLASGLCAVVPYGQSLPFPVTTRPTGRDRISHLDFRCFR